MHEIALSLHPSPHVLFLAYKLRKVIEINFISLL